MDEKIRSLVDELRKDFEDVEIGGALHGAVIQIAVRMGMPKEKFLEVAEMLFTRMQSIVADTKKEQN